ncbi:D-arabinono-1,4-lactone oxidase [Aeromicrobium duanguangcaii]|uniref:FAD-binding protein n=1 Tax=Aeromicrobium duanguangcaii TaxID=2968086 RepID=A0ABY5KCH4_9ACTN|nr:D-arabinono-1,4-lactone oxidase [Aeromicrobium duanguangcaii]MCD9155192.1 FAD-binding protein [Aeromicrobium duanguangcaii]UUI68157.1 FAD-binding protein [Aeromicrobium duanguangcaii]
MTTWRNWAGNVTAHPAVVGRPASTDEVVAFVREHPQVKAVGAGHSFTPIAATDGALLRLDAMSRILHADTTTGLVRVQAGISLHDLNRRLDALGLALPNLGDVDPQSVAGATSTGTHGTGARLFGIARAVAALQLVTAEGEVLEIDRGHDMFDAARVGLGALGIVTEVTLQCVPAFLLHAREEPMALSAVLTDLDQLVDGNDHFEFYFFPHTDRALTKRNNRVPEGTPRAPLSRWRHTLDDEFLSNTVYERIQRIASRRPALIPRINALSGSVLGAREYTDTSHEVFISPRRVRFRESEFALPRAAAADAIAEMQRWYARTDQYVSFPVEVRFTAADDIWMSTGFERDTVYIAVHQFHRTDPTSYFAAMQDIFIAHEGRPHWGKMHTLGSDHFRKVYPRFDDFLGVRDRLDPGRKFANDYLRQVLGS